MLGRRRDTAHFLCTCPCLQAARESLVIPLRTDSKLSHLRLTLLALLRWWKKLLSGIPLAASPCYLNLLKTRLDPVLSGLLTRRLSPCSSLTCSSSLLRSGLLVRPLWAAFPLLVSMAIALPPRSFSQMAVVARLVSALPHSLSSVFAFHDQLLVHFLWVYAPLLECPLLALPFGLCGCDKSYSYSPLPVMCLSLNVNYNARAKLQPD